MDQSDPLAPHGPLLTARCQCAMLPSDLCAFAHVACNHSHCSDHPLLHVQAGGRTLLTIGTWLAGTWTWTSCIAPIALGSIPALDMHSLSLEPPCNGCMLSALIPALPFLLGLSC